MRLNTLSLIICCVSIGVTLCREFYTTLMSTIRKLARRCSDFVNAVNFLFTLATVSHLTVRKPNSHLLMSEYLNLNLNRKSRRIS